MVESAVGQESLTYIPLSSFIILLVILLTCASRRKKIDAFNAVEQSYDNDIKGEYAIMCFPCLRKKPNLKNFQPTADLSDQFEYIVEKYTIRKVPLLLANTEEDILERQEELEMSTPKSQTQLLKDDFVNFHVAHEIYNVQRMPPCYTVAANTACPGSKAIKERPRPADVLESMSPVRRSPKNHNYVVIPTKGSLRHKDIMMTKREITNQYLNNFSSVFVDNLKDQVPKDPEQLPGLSRPYTSAFKNFPICADSSNRSGGKKSKKYKSQKVAYAFPTEETKIDNPIREPFYDSDSMQDQMTDLLDSEYQDDIENGNDTEIEDRVNSHAKEDDSYSLKDNSDSINIPKPFKTAIRPSEPNAQEFPPPEDTVSCYKGPHANHRIDWKNSKNVTYEDIQALDVGYEFKSCEKFGVKPQMTRIHYPLPSYDATQFKDPIKQLGLGDSTTVSKRRLSQDLVTKSSKSGALKTPSGVSTKAPEARVSLNLNTIMSPSEKTSSKSIITETSFLPKTGDDGKLAEEGSLDIDVQGRISESTFSAKSERSKSVSANEVVNSSSAAAMDSVTEISKLYDLSRPITEKTMEATASEKGNETSEQGVQLPVASKSRSLHCPDVRKEGVLEVKGNDNLPFTNSNPSKDLDIRIEEPDTETSGSLYSHESKTSTVVTSPRSSDIDEGKRATLRWKIVIKHHREDDSTRRNVNVNIKH